MYYQLNLSIFSKETEFPVRIITSHNNKTEIITLNEREENVSKF
jgi:hypothetical protein